MSFCSPWALRGAKKEGAIAGGSGGAVDSTGKDEALRAEPGQPVPGLLGTQVSPLQGSMQRALLNVSAAAKERMGRLPGGEEQRAAEVACGPQTLALAPTLPRTTCDIWAVLGTAQWQQELPRGAPTPPGRQVSKPKPWLTPQIPHRHLSCRWSGWTWEVSLPGHPKFP